MNAIDVNHYLTQWNTAIKDNDILTMEQLATYFAFDVPEYVDDTICSYVLLSFEKAVEQGSYRAMLNLGALYYNGVLINRDYEKAMALYTMASQSDAPEIAGTALCNLGYCHYYGRCGTVDYKKAFFCYQKGALLANNVSCLYKLGDMYYLGKYVEKDKRLALVLYKRAYHTCPQTADAFPDILKRLGEHYLLDEQERDVVTALQYLTEAQGHLYKKIHKQRDPYAVQVLDEVETLIKKAKSDLFYKEIGYGNEL